MKYPLDNSIFKEKPEGEKMPGKKLTQWSVKFKKCQGCGSKKGKHRSRGLCQSCYSKYQRERNTKMREETNDRAMALLGRPLQWTKERIEQEAEALIAWSVDEELKPLVLEEFGLYRNPPYIREIMYKLGEINDNFRLALLVAKERIRSRKESGAYRHIYNAQFVGKMHGYQDRKDNDKNVSYSEYRKDMKAAEKKAETDGIAEAILRTRQFIDDANERIRKEKEERSK